MSKLYIVQRRTWFNEYAGYEDEDCIKDGGVPVAAYENKKDAQAHAKQLEKSALEEASSLFRLVNTDYLEMDLELSEEKLCETIAALGLTPPEPVTSRYGSPIREWTQWYDDVAETLTPAQQKAIFKQFRKIKVYQVVEVDLED